MSDQLRNKTIGALFWSFFDRIGQNGLQFVISIVLARLLAPAEFGLIAILSVFMAVAQSIIDSGFGSALIQKQDVSHVDECSIFYFNIIVGIFVAGLLCLVAPWIARFYNAPLLVFLTRALSLNLVINAFGLIQTSLLSKRIDFKSQFKISFIATAFSGMIGILMAYNGFGVWSLAAQSLSQNLFRTFLLWYLMSWRPSWIFSFLSIQTLFVFGSKLFFAGLLETIFQNIYLVIIGKLFPPADLGFYARARSIEQLPVQNITGTVGRVTYPVFSSMQEDRKRLKSAVRKALLTIAMMIFPVMIGLAAVAEPLVSALLTDKWLPCVIYLQLLCAVGILYPLHAVNLNVLKAQGRSDLFFKIEVLKKFLVVVAIAMTYQSGISAMIIGQIATSFLAYYMNSYYTGKLLDYGVTEQIRDVIPALIISCIMGGVVYGVTLVPLSTPLISVIVQITAGIILYIAICCLVRKNEILEIMTMIKQQWLILRRADSRNLKGD
ncbi:MAG: lipopolysaccharide biosynthesis protein [Deltaproteobacteria bacterium]|nr:lipopolysaccharide biosynthesis protein [Deltaproteobacteria bacterium]